jgi:hypothetical protein
MTTFALLCALVIRQGCTGSLLLRRNERREPEGFSYLVVAGSKNLDLDGCGRGLLGRRQT